MAIIPPWLYSAPEWFVGLDAAFELIYFIITLSIFYSSWKIYKLTGRRQLRLFSLSFLSISLSYLGLSVLNGALHFGLLSRVEESMGGKEALLLLVLSIYGHMFFFTLGLLSLAYMTLKIKHLKAYLLIVSLAFVALVFARHKLDFFYLYTSLLLGFICTHYCINYWRKKHFTTFLVLAGFIFIFVGKVGAIFSISNNIFYVVSHIFELVGYVLLLTNLFLVMKK